MTEPINERSTGRGWKIFLGIIVGLIAIAGIAYGIDYFATKDKVPRGTAVGGVDIGGMDPAAAEEKLRTELGGIEETPVSVSAAEEATTFVPADAGLTIDWAATVAQAGSESANPITRLRGFFTTTEVPTVSVVDEEALAPELDRMTAELATEPADGAVELVNGEVHVTDAVLGQEVERAELHDAVVEDWLDPAGVEVEPLPVEPAITQEIVDATAQGEAAEAVGGPLVLNGEDGVSATLEPVAISGFVAFHNNPEAGAIDAEVDTDAAQTLLSEQLAETETEGQNARISRDGSITPHVDGYVIDWEQAMENFPARVLGEAPREWDAVYEAEPADFTTADAEAADFSEVMGSFTTSGASSTSAHNIAVIVADINGVIVNPGETFSVNRFTGPRGTAQGYVEGGTIENGRAGRAVGGGISQFATTLYNAYYFAGLEDVTHTPHSYYISRYPAGREATIYEGAIDLAFRNNTQYPVRIEASSGGDSVTVRIMGKDLYDVESVSGGRWAYTSPQTLNLSGSDCIPSGGIQGFTTSDTRIIRDKSGAEVKRETRTTVYDPQPIVRCG